MHYLVGVRGARPQKKIGEAHLERYKSSTIPIIFLAHTTMIRAFSTSAISAFKKESVQQFNNVAKAAAVPKKWQPTPGNSFRSFAEYRLRAVNQSPLNLRAIKKGN